MKVGLVLERFDRRRGGLEVWATNFATALLERGHEVHVLAFDHADPPRDSRLVLHRLDGHVSRLVRAETVHSRLATLGLDVVHDCGVGWRCDVLHVLAGGRLEALARSCAVLPRWRRPLARMRRRVGRNVREQLHLEALQMAHRASLVVVPSQATGAELTRRYRPTEGRLRLVPNAVDLESFSPGLRSLHRERVRRELGVGEETLFLSVAQNPLLKGAPTTIRALASLHREGRAASLAHLGGGDLAPLRSLARSLGVETAVRFVGHVDDSAPYYAAADAFLHPTLRDTCSLSVLEAAASGLPVAVSRFDGAVELLAGGAGALVLEEAENWRALAAIMRRLGDPAIREAAGRAAREAVAGFGFDRQVAAIIELYDEIRERRGQ